MDLKEIQNLIKFVAKSGASEVKLEMDDVKITIKTGTEGNASETTYIQHVPVALRFRNNLFRNNPRNKPFRLRQQMLFLRKPINTLL